MQTATLFNQQTMLVDDADSLGIMANGIFEPSETHTVLALVKGGDRVLDIGANMGYYTVLMAEKVGAQGQVFAIEPNAANLSILHANTLAWQQSARVTVLPCALSDTKGAGSLFLSTHNSGMHRMYASIVCTDDVETVDMVCGDELGFGAIDFIKIDIEGYEPKALRGLVNTLKSSPEVKILSEFSPLSLMEAGESPSQFIRWMTDLGFVAMGLQGNTWCLLSTDALLASVERLESLQFAELVKSLSGLDNPTILARVMDVASQRGYDRPILENLLFVRPHSVGAIEQLALPQ
jgi:FkbM family methyltransferase